MNPKPSPGRGRSRNQAAGRLESISAEARHARETLTIVVGQVHYTILRARGLYLTLDMGAAWTTFTFWGQVV